MKTTRLLKRRTALALQALMLAGLVLATAFSAADRPAQTGAAATSLVTTSRG